MPERPARSERAKKSNPSRRPSRHGPRHEQRQPGRRHRTRQERPAASRQLASGSTTTRTAVKADRPVYVGHVVPGLERIARRELTTALPDVEMEHTLQAFDERTSLLIFAWPGDPADLLELRTFEDVFALIADRDGLPTDRSALAMIQAAIAGSGGTTVAAERAAQVRPGGHKKPTFRVVSRKAGQHAFRRVDVQTAAERGLLQRFLQWRLVADGARFEVWTNLVDTRLVAGIRLSDESMRQRTYKTANLPASLKPTIAQAMVQLSQPADDDVFLDPMCGAGTILLERAHAGRYQILQGRDISPDAVDATLENFGPRHKPYEIRIWDARSLPFAEGEISAVVTNMPFGRQIGSTEDNRALYPALIAEWSRVLRPGGRMVLLTSERSILRRALSDHPELIQEQQVPVNVRGFPATIYVLQRLGRT